MSGHLSLALFTPDSLWSLTFPPHPTSEIQPQLTSVGSPCAMMLTSWLSLMLLPLQELWSCSPSLTPTHTFLRCQLGPHFFSFISFLDQSLLWLPLSGPLCLLDHPDQPEPHHLLTSLDVSPDSKHHEAMGSVFLTLPSQGLGACLAHDCA